MISVTILGYGNVGKHLYEALSKTTGVQIHQVFARTLAPPLRKDPIFIDTLQALTPCDVIILAVKDDAIASLSEKIPFSGTLVVHTSGSMPLACLDGKNRRGVFYPLQTFSKEANVDFKNIPICVEAENAEDVKLLMKLGGLLSETVQEIPSEARKKLHLAATWVNNFNNHIFHLASEYLEENGLSFNLLKPLIMETALKVQHLPPSEAQTGPALRRDAKTLESHLALMRNPELKEIYKLLTKSIQNKNK